MGSLFWTFLLFLAIVAWLLPWGLRTGMSAEWIAFGLVGLAALAALTRANGSLWRLFAGTMRLALPILGLLMVWVTSGSGVVAAVLLLAIVAFAMYLMLRPFIGGATRS